MLANQIRAHIIRLLCNVGNVAIMRSGDTIGNLAAQEIFESPVPRHYDELVGHKGTWILTRFLSTMEMGSIGFRQNTIL